MTLEEAMDQSSSLTAERLLKESLNEAGVRAAANATPPRGNDRRRAHHRFASLGSGSSQSLIVTSIPCCNAAALRCFCAC